MPRGIRIHALHAVIVEVRIRVKCALYKSIHSRRSVTDHSIRLENAPHTKYCHERVAKFRYTYVILRPPTRDV
jgi:hypothetical protein